MAAANHMTASKAAIAASPMAWLDDLRIRFNRYRLYRKTVNELSALSNRELADLGLNSSMIKRISYQAAYENN
ncbi:hypothetical protein RSK20926_15777 [Roseobacter sp. SK209-2-6]|uniref:DUF1127 domain-containing protein n=1 Tax=Roseobacter sp. SK209-2-6 TaxID=388739 RepID=UPI0000F3CC77|nr:DUF1127 domain-containing protein [Roseobacter sp. SK209-2-6]EBA14325.1 hypothetical protein RSK20926_15777 [Roseobacter sp. SK209-2-6]